jgi:hypothetical protein
VHCCDQQAVRERWATSLLQFPVANLALRILFARTAPTGRPLVAQLAAEVVALRQPSAATPALTASSAR